MKSWEFSGIKLFEALRVDNKTVLFSRIPMDFNRLLIQKLIAKTVQVLKIAKKKAFNPLWEKSFSNRSNTYGKYIV